MRPIVVVVFAAGCYGSPAHPAAPATKLACAPVVKIDLGESGDGTTGKVVLDGTDLKLAVEHEAGKSEGDAVVYPLGPHTVLLGWTIYGHYGRPAGSDTLYAVDCIAKTATPFFTDPAGDFGHSTMTRDGKTIYFSALGGVRALDIATKQTRQVTPKVALGSCGDRGELTDENGNPQPRTALSAVRSLDETEDLLIYEDGDNCGFEGDWSSSTMYLDHPGVPGGKPYAPRAVAQVAVDAGGVVWASTGSCDEAKLWRSLDRGDRWARVTLPAADDDERGPNSGDGGPVAILADAKRPGAVVVETNTCAPMGMVLPHRLLVTHDGGATWTTIPLPPPDPIAINTLALRGGSVDHLMIWGRDQRWVEGESTEVDLAWEWITHPSPDEDVWTELEAPPPTPPPSGTVAKLGELTFRTSPNGLLRSRGSEKPTRLFPR